jgi:CheY-like chemotaxis protein
MESQPLPYRLLLVDDVSAVREALRWAFEGMPDMEVVGEAADGPEALACALALAPDMVILDIGLPHIDGLAVAQQLKQQKKAPLIIFLTVQADPVTRQQAAAAGGDGFVEKGTGWPGLMSQIRHLLGARRPPGDRE